MSRAVVAFGANLGDREATIAAAVRELADTEGVALVAVSPVYETAAITDAGVDTESPGYLNGVVVIETSLDPHALLERLHAIEATHGRERTEHWGARTLDLDLIDVDGQVLDETGLEDTGLDETGLDDTGRDDTGRDDTGSDDTGLVLPHPRAWQRAFVLQPWLDLEPDATLAGYGPIAALRAAAVDEVTRR